MKIFLPEPGPWRRFGVAVALSVLIHVGLFGLGLLRWEGSPRVFVKKGEPIIVELQKPEEAPAPRGNPALPPGPSTLPARPAAPKSPPAVKPAPKIETAQPAPKPVPLQRAPAPSKPAPEPAPPQVAKAPPPEPEGTKAAPAPPKEEPKPEPSVPPSGEPRVAVSKPPPEVPPGPPGGIGGGRPGGGGGLLGGRGGIEGEPIPLDTTDPRYTDYFEKIRRRIKENWIYPREAGERGIGGQLLIEFGIRKDGWLQFVDLRRSSGVQILDQYALNALKLAQPFPPVPDSIAKSTLGIAGIFTYQIVDSGLLNQYLR